MTHIVGHMSQKLKADIIPLSIWTFQTFVNISSETLPCVMYCEHQISVRLKLETQKYFIEMQKL